MADLTVRVARVHDEALEIRSFELVRTDGGALPPFEPGSHIDVRIGQDLVRQYSLCSPSGQTASYLIAVKKEPGSRGGSRAMHEQMKEGSELAISNPRNKGNVASSHRVATESRERQRSDRAVLHERRFQGRRHSLPGKAASTLGGALERFSSLAGT